MITKAWAKSHQKLLRRMLTWPLLWKIAVRIIVKHIDHDAAYDCLLCAAGLSTVQDAHRPMMGGDRQMFCRKCGLPSRVWTGKCSGKRPLVKEKPQPLFMHIPID